jgi:ABC-type Fe3+/spermidine/putrescine transport system ATPase subunit
VSAAVQARGLVVRAGGQQILGPLDLDVTEREHLLLVGPSGSGKTTLLRALAGLVAPAAGTIALFGTPASAPGRVLVRPERRPVGMLFQGGALWPHMSVERTLHFVLAHAGVPAPARAARSAALLEQVRLSGKEKRMPGTLSGGERQRLALARALATEPRLLLLDEPLGPLDAALRADLLGMLAGLHGALGCTTIHVTHDPTEARPYATRVLRLEAGRVATAGATA